MKNISEISFSNDLVQIGSLQYSNGSFAKKERGGDKGTETERGRKTDREIGRQREIHRLWDQGMKKSIYVTHY